ncbi:hypothetical protein E2C01_024155 [Portunus trituberculatus]|uniref:Uncharacterized protein n=1 Tax=Portunus trituberculatus TaxID=210409 RepID=A0A5B7ED34_PORTR|nr:hypothetical protein [Portunus trituberculatus]
MSSSGDDDDCDQIKSTQVFSLHLQHHPAQREAVIGEWQLSHREPICNLRLGFKMCSFSFTNSKIFFSTSTPYFETFLLDVTT